MSENILESELFGHIKGAFTGADRERKGWFEHANGGTMFLDEVGDIPLSTQVKLLRVLESGEIVRVGTNEPVKVNVRLISATNRDLKEGIGSGGFRQDLYHRLKVVSVHLPPLRSRREDITLLTDYFLKQFTASHGKVVTSISPAARKALMTHPWPGNVRELKNTIESMVVVDYDGILDVDDLTEDLAPTPRRLVRPPVRPELEPARRPAARGDREVLHRRDPQAHQPATARKPPSSSASASGPCIVRSRNMGSADPESRKEERHVGCVESSKTHHGSNPTKVRHRRLDAPYLYSPSIHPHTDNPQENSVFRMDAGVPFGDPPR